MRMQGREKRKQKNINRSRVVVKDNNRNREECGEEGRETLARHRSDDGSLYQNKYRTMTMNKDKNPDLSNKLRCRSNHIKTH